MKKGVMKFFFVTIVEIKRPRWQILNLGKWLWTTWLISTSQEKEKNIESLTGFEHIQFCIYTEYVPNEKTQIPCWLCPVLFPQLVYFQMSVNGMWWLWKRKKIYRCRGMKPIGEKILICHFCCHFGFTQRKAHSFCFPFYFSSCRF